MKSNIIILLLFACTAAAQSLPEEARKLVEKRAAEVHKINLAYAQALDALLAKYRAAGQAANAKAVEGLIAEAEGKKPDSAAEHVLAPLVGVWRNEDGVLWKFTSVEDGIYAGKQPFELSYDPLKQRVVAVSKSWVNWFSFTADRDLMNGSYEKNGRTIRYKLKRVK